MTSISEPVAITTETGDGRPTPLVEMSDIRVSFGGVHAVDGVSVDLFPGEVVALVGGNGAGKSTLMKALSGAHPADSGEILIDGEPVSIKSPRDARPLGIETIYQTLALADNIDAAANVFLGREVLTRTGALDDSAMATAWRCPPDNHPTGVLRLVNRGLSRRITSRVAEAIAESSRAPVRVSTSRPRNTLAAASMLSASASVW